MPFEFKQLKIKEVVLITPKVFEDERGFFLELFKESSFKEHGINIKIVQENQSFSHKGVIRGLHYQIKPKAQGKLVSVAKGKIFDVAVDIRKDSQTFGKWVSAILSSDNKQMLWIPEGFAHGFCALEDSIVVYRTTNEYSPIHERGIRWDDKTININWPIKNPIISLKDKNFKGLI